MPTHKLTPEIINAAIVGFEQQRLRIDAQIVELRAILDVGRTEPVATPEVPMRKRRKMSASARKRIGDAQRKRWAESKGQPGSPSKTGTAKPQRKLSAAGKAAIVAALKKRWATKKAAAAAAVPAVAKKAAGKKAAVKTVVTKKAMGLAGEAVKHILAEAGPKGIVTPSPVDRTATLQLIPVPAQARHLIMVQRRFQVDGSLHHTEIHPFVHFAIFAPVRATTASIVNHTQLSTNRHALGNPRTLPPRAAFSQHSTHRFCYRAHLSCSSSDEVSHDDPAPRVRDITESCVQYIAGGGLWEHRARFYGHEDFTWADSRFRSGSRG